MCAADGNNVDPVVVQLCTDVIRKNLGTLDDLPRELANTVANVYYRCLKLSGDVAAQAKGNPGWRPPSSENDSGLKDSLVTFMHALSSCMTDSQSVKGFIDALRGIDRNQQPHLYAYTVEFILDCLKYDIPNASEKSSLRRRFERLFRKGKVKEIPNLIDRINI